ncbi:MAG: hypothetical protein H7A32_03350 [Deltaproteobacteria bacterium]|nr:hypothetical protein [Deltaproteobacteria bacterium]
MRVSILFSFSIFVLIFSSISLAESDALPEWMQDLPLIEQQNYYLVVKGIYSNQKEAEETQKLIQHLMGSTPADRWDTSDHYLGLPKGKYIVGMLFDSVERAQWWIKFSYRNRKISKGKLYSVKILSKSNLPYMPDPVRVGRKNLVTQKDALASVKLLPDIQDLTKKKKLIFKFTDYPRNGDLRYEIEVLEHRSSSSQPVMVDFIMVSALNASITERLSTALGKQVTSAP